MTTITRENQAIFPKAPQHNEQQIGDFSTTRNSTLSSSAAQRWHNDAVDRSNQLMFVSADATATVSHQESSPSTEPIPASPTALDPEEQRHDTPDIHGRLVDDDDDAAILEDARRDILSQAVLAEVQQVEPTAAGELQFNNFHRFGALFVVLLLLGVIVASVCGSGNCTGSSKQQQQQQLSKEEIVETISAARIASSHYNNVTIDYPVIDREILTPQEAALKYVVETTIPNSNSDSWRLVQRYALCVFWFTNTKATHPESQNDKRRPAFARFTDDECVWEGISCDANHRVTEMRVRGTQMSGTLPDDAFGLLTDLTVLDLAKNSFSGELPTVLAALSRLEILDISENAFGGSLFPAYLDNSLQQLVEFKASRNRFQGSIPASLGNQTLLDTLHIMKNAALRGTIPLSLAALTALTSLHFGGATTITGVLPTFLQTLTNLRHLEIGALTLNNEDDTANQDLSLYTKLTKLTHLSMASVLTMDQTIPSILGEVWPDMQEFKLWRNTIVGTLPPSLAQWSLLRELNVGGNNGISGSVPIEYFESWPDLTAFHVWQNNITGTLPSSIGGCWSQLESLEVGRNQFTGTIPTELGLLTNMRVLLLQSNRFTGTIPVEMANLPHTRKWFHQNNFTGPTPFCQSGQKSTETTVDCEKVVCPCCVDSLNNLCS